MSAARKKPVKRSAKKTAKPSGQSSERAMVPQPHGGALLPGAGGGPQPGSGRPPSQVKALAAAKLPRHVDTLDGIANGTAYITLRGKCGKCGNVATDADMVAPVAVKPGEQVRAVEALAKLADSKELVITNGNAASFFDCIHQAIVESFGEAGAIAVQSRAVKLMESAA